MRSIGEFFYLLYLRVKVFFYNWKDERSIRSLFPSFKRLDQALLASPNPYRIPKAFPYGETPLFTFKQMADRWHITDSDYVIELGCGRGRGSFFLAHYTGCTVKGIDWTPSFISHATTVASQFPHLGVSFACKDMRQADLSRATVIYLYGTCLDEASIEALSQMFHKLPSATKIITVSYPLPYFLVKDEFVGSFPWGKTEIYLQSHQGSEIPQDL